ncbi:MAG: hypothetical protein KDJ88_01060 [Bauldia sp.]|nr:hypothetical protein [Bauldia sp.]
MSYRIPIRPTAVLSEDGIWDLAPVPAERVVRFADTPVSFVAETDAIRLKTADETSFRPKGRICH